jgi:ABC-type branched-subunit amino acid transport system substrate-binding protein
MEDTAWKFTRRAALALLAVLASTAWAQGRNIVVGQSIVLAGPGALRAQPYYEGAKLYFDRVNAAGGVNGRKIELVTLDDHGSPALTVENTKKLLAQQPLLLFGYYGSPQVTAAYPLIKEADITLFAPMTAADDFRDSAHSHIYTLRPGYADEAAAITRHAATLGTKRLVILHSTDGESKSALESAQKTVGKLGAVLAGTYPVPSGAVAEAVDNALVAKPESVLVIGDANSAANVIRDIRAKGFRGPIYGFSNTGESLLAEEVGAEGAGVVVARVVPKAENPNVPVGRELVADAAAAKAGKPNVFMLEGYIAARVLIDALKRIPGEPTRAKLKTALDSLHDINVGGFRVDFSKGRVGSKLIDLALIDSQGRVRE